MRIVVLTGGIGGARFLVGVRALCPARSAPRSPRWSTSATTYACTACRSAPTWTASCTRWAAPPTRSAAGAGSARPGWSRRSWPTYGAEPTWFGLGDKDIATHLVRTTMLNAGYPLSAVTAALCDRWQPGVTHAAGHRRPAGDARRGGRRRRAQGHPLPGVVGAVPRRACRRHRFVFVGAETAKPAAGVLEAIGRGGRGADRAEQPGGQHRADPGRAAAPGGRGGRPGAGGRGVPDHRRRAGARHGRPLPGRRSAWRCSAAGVGALYGARADGGLLDGWLVDPADAGADVPGVDRPGGPAVDDGRGGHGRWSGALRPPAS